MRKFSDTFWRRSWGVCTLLQNNFDFFVCQLVCYLAYFLPKNRQIRDISSSGWGNFLNFVWDIPGMLVHQFQIILNILLVFQYVDGQFPYWKYTHRVIYSVLDNISFWIFGDFSWQFGNFSVNFGLLFVSLGVSFWDLWFSFICFPIISFMICFKH